MRDTNIFRNVDGYRETLWHRIGSPKSDQRKQPENIRFAIAHEEARNAHINTRIACGARILEG